MSEIRRNTVYLWFVSQLLLNFSFFSFNKTPITHIVCSLPEALGNLKAASLKR